MSYEAPHFDDSPEDAESLLPPSYEGQFIVLEARDVLYILTPENTKVRKFTVGSGEFDYLIHSISNDQDFFHFFDENERGKQLRDLMEECDFDVEVSTSLDEQAIALYSRAQAEQLPDTISELLSD